ncbi:MAG: thiol-disulfide oxidoreductase ResA [Gemmatimonadota bacterium]|jgi:thiol-disulfide isomerase/thioredoxin
MTAGMTERRQWLVILGASIALGVGIWVAMVRLAPELFPLKIGAEAPDFAALPVAASGAASAPETKGIDAYQGEVVLLNIWATWCGPCRVEMPSMQRLHERLGPKGLKIVAVSVDDPGSARRIREFADELGLSFELLHDASKGIEGIYQTTGVPETFLIGRDGTIRRRSIGAEAWDSEANVAQLERLLAEPRP